MHITVTDALTSLSEVVREYGPEHAYARPDGRCTYTEDEAPSCLVAQALYRLGVPLTTLADFDRQAFGSIMYVMLPEGLTIDADAREVFGAAQTVQDGGARWNTALIEAQHKADELAKGPSSYVEAFASTDPATVAAHALAA